MTASPRNWQTYGADDGVTIVLGHKILDTARRRGFEVVATDEM